MRGALVSLKSGKDKGEEVQEGGTGNAPPPSRKGVSD
jgi:hypothetical protein